METTISKLTVFYDNPFWVAIYERTYNGVYQASRIVFGVEPKDYEVYEYMLQNFCKLRFSPPHQASEFEERKVNPKKMQRDIKKQLQNKGTGTKSMQALKLMQEQNKLERKANRRLKNEEEKQLHFELRSKKKKEKHKGH